MISLTLGDIAKAVDGNLVNSEDANIIVDSVGTDTRQIQDNCLFIALQGASFDAHEFLTEAQKAGAKAVIIHRHIDTGLPAVLVKDTRIALGKLSAYVKSKITHLKCVAITGSNGKTTTKELLSAILKVYADVESEDTVKKPHQPQGEC
ncbi:Mur ligase domain-containing protein [Psychromonas sp. KJ10-10]|uniref:Mur ligase domain-containing protein n=1 Tax=Psychromonas sp. KJ10-10 TaxID=3391823 RepID=UPI0039B5DFF2